MKKIILLMGLLLIVGNLAQAKAKIQKVFVAVAKSSEIFDQLTYPARVVPTVSAMIFSESHGVVTSLTYKLGQKVKKNQTIAKVTHTDPVYQYRPFSLRAPVDGVVTKVFTNIGSQVSKGDKVILLTDPTKAKLVIEIAAKDLLYFKPGMNGAFKTRTTNKKIEVSITGISPLIDAATGTATAELELNLTDADRVLPGTIGKVSFKTNIHTGLVFSQSVLTYKGKQPQVRIVSKENKVKKVDVKLGSKRRGKVEILSGIKVGDYVVEKASGFIKENAIVSIQNLPTKNKEKKK